MPTSETQAVNASVPTTGDQGQVMSKMIYLHVTKPHSLTQIAICSKTKCRSMEEQGTATVLSCEGWEPGTRLGRRWGLAQGCCKAKTFSFICDNLRLAGGWIQVRTISPICVGWKLQTSPCIDALTPGTHTSHTLTLILQDPAATACNMPTSHLLLYSVTGSQRHAVKKLVLQFSCTRCAISNTFDNLQYAISAW